MCFVVTNDMLSWLLIQGAQGDQLEQELNAMKIEVVTLKDKLVTTKANLFSWKETCTLGMDVQELVHREVQECFSNLEVSMATQWAEANGKLWTVDGRLNRHRHHINNDTMKVSLVVPHNLSEADQRCRSENLRHQCAQWKRGLR